MPIKKDYLWLHIIQYILVLGSYSFLVYKLVQFDGYADVLNYFSSVSFVQYFWLLLVLLLMLVNITIEAQKWNLLVENIEKHSLFESLQAVLVGWMAAFFTPNRLGEFPGRVLHLKSENRWSGIALGGIGSVTQMLVIVGCGLPASLFFFMQSELTDNVLPILLGYAGIFLILLALSVFLPKISTFLLVKHSPQKRFQMLLESIAAFPILRFLGITFLSLLRYAVFSVQFYLMLRFCSVQLSFLQALIVIPTYYLFVTFTPSISISEAAIRGSWAVVTIGLYTQNTAGIVLAAVLLWCINGVLPMLAGSFVRKEVPSHHR